MDNYRFYLSARVQCFKSSEQDFSPYSFVIWFRCGPWRLHLLIGVTHVLRFPSCSKCGVGSILLSVFVLIDPGPSLGRVWELKNPPCFAPSVLAHRDKAEIKCMGPVGGKHQQNQKYICSSLTLSIVSKTKLMDNKIMSVAFKTFIRSDRST